MSVHNFKFRDLSQQIYDRRSQERKEARMSKTKIAKCYQPGCESSCDAGRGLGIFAGRWHVHCDDINCGYVSGAKPTEAEAIAAHNSVARAVAAEGALREALTTMRARLGDSAGIHIATRIVFQGFIDAALAPEPEEEKRHGHTD